MNEAIQELITQLVAAWNRRDVRAFASLFTADAHYITGRGQWLQGREAIEEEFSTSDALDSAVIIKDTRIKLLRPDIALAHNTWEMSGPLSQGGEGTRLRRGIITQVLIRQGDRWLIAALQNTDMEVLESF